jgi:nucleotide-binding universal stress UspA family protein
MNMKKILIAVDETKGTKELFNVCSNMCSSALPETIVLCYVEKLEGRSLMDDTLLSISEMSTLKEVLEGTEYQEALDKKAQAVLNYYKKALEEKGLTAVKTITRKGHPAEEILKAADDEGVDLIMIGSRGSRTSHLFMGSVSREVVNGAKIPVLIVKRK